MAGERNFRNANLRGANFKGQDLSGADFSGADIRSANFTNATLRGVNFTKAQAGLQRQWTAVQLLLIVLLEPAVRWPFIVNSDVWVGTNLSEENVMEVLIETIVSKLRRLPTDKLMAISDFVSFLDWQESNNSDKIAIARSTRASQKSTSVGIENSKVAESDAESDPTPALSKVRAELRKSVEPGYSLADELIRERRQESKYE